MRIMWTHELSTILVATCLAGVALQARAQDAQPDPVVQQTPPTAIPTPTVETPPPPNPAPSLIVPSYQPTEYALTPPGSNNGPRSEVRRWPNRPLMITSSLMFVGAYVPSVFFAKYNNDTTNNLYIPVAGPWLELAREPASAGSKALLAISGVFQDLGALGMVTSLFVPERRTSHWFLIGNRRLSAAPVADRYMYGVSARGRF